jgi:hypothetical protein
MKYYFFLLRAAEVGLTDELGLEQVTIACSHRCGAPDKPEFRRRAQCMWNHTFCEPEEVWRSPPQANVGTPNRELLYARGVFALPQKQLKTAAKSTSLMRF